MRLVILAGLEEEAGRAFGRRFHAVTPDGEVGLIAAEADMDAIVRAAQGKGEIVAILWSRNEGGATFNATAFEAQMRQGIGRIRHDLDLAETVPFIMAVQGAFPIGDGMVPSPAGAALGRLAATTPYVGLVQAGDLPGGGNELPFPAELIPSLPAGTVGRRIWRELLIESCYDGYLQREQQEIARRSRMEGVDIPGDLPIDTLPGLSNEARQKLLKVRPCTLGQASRIDGVTPADVALLQIHISGRRKK